MDLCQVPGNVGVGGFMLTANALLTWCKMQLSPLVVPTLKYLRMNALLPRVGMPLN